MTQQLGVLAITNHVRTNLDGAPDCSDCACGNATMSVAADGVILFASDSAAALLHSSVHSLKSRRISDVLEFYSTLTGQPIRDFWSQHFRSDDAASIEGIELRNTAGRRFSITELRCCRHAAENACGVISFRTLRHDQIEYSEDQSLLDITARLALVGGWDVCAATGRVRWTAQTFRIHELEPGDTPPLSEAIAFYLEEDRPILEAALQRAMEHGEPYDLELRLKTAKGNLRHVKTMCQPVVADGRTITLRGTFQDITQRKTAENALSESDARYRDIFENNSAVKLIIDPADGRIVEANSAALQFYGYSADEIRQLTIADINVADAKTVTEKLHLARDEQITELEFQHRLASGEIRDVKVHTGPVHIDQKTHVHSIIFDITESKRAEEALLRMQQLESLGTLAGGIAHDFNNVLTAVFGNLSIAKDTLDPSHPATEFLQKAEGAINRAAGLSKQLLTFAKGGAPIRESVSLVELITSVVSFDLSGSNVLPSFDFSPDLHHVHVDRAQLQQVFSNLTLNADQSMPDGGKLLVTACNSVLSASDVPGLLPGDYVEIRFTDEGCGIAADDLKRIFEPYFSTKPTGSGLGLATSHSIVKKHLGHIDVDSEFGVGTTFRILLPAAGEKQQQSDAETNFRVGTDATVRRVLILDDEQMILDVMTQMLAMTRATVKTCQTTDCAVTSYQQAFDDGEPFDVVILDLTIPGDAGGKDAIRRILAIDPYANVVCSSGYTDDHVMAEFEKYGFKAVIAKPYTSAALRGVVESFPLRRILREPT